MGQAKVNKARGSRRLRFIGLMNRVSKYNKKQIQRFADIRGL